MTGILLLDVSIPANRKMLFIFTRTLPSAR